MKRCLKCKSKNVVTTGSIDIYECKDCGTFQDLIEGKIIKIEK